MAAAPQTYEEEQAALRRQHEGEVEEEPLFEIPQMPEVNPVIYKDVEPMLLRGFITTSADINGVPFVFKSLNQHEFRMLGLVSGDDLFQTPSATNRRFNLFLAYGVLMTDGVNILPDRDEWIRDLADLFKDLHTKARERVIYHLSEINRRAAQATQLVEAFALETKSRVQWLQIKGLDLTSTAVTGVRGTERLGLNWAQLAWRALNQAQDRKEYSEREWENAKFIASSMAGKGMSKIHSADKRRRREEREEAMERRDRIIRSAVFGEDVSKQAQHGAPMKVARTVEELANQLERDLKGEKDWHDMVVESHEERARMAFEKRAEDIAALYEANRKRFGDHALVGQTSLEGLSPEEVRFRLQRRQQLAAQRLAAQQAYPELHDPKIGQFNQKWLNRPQGQGPKGLPFKRGED